MVTLTDKNTLDEYPFLKAALEDVHVSGELQKRGIGSARHVVCLYHDTIEFMLYECLRSQGVDIYKNGQNTMGLDEAIKVCEEKGILLPLISTIRTIQKHRGDAKHHAQTPHENAFQRMAADFPIIVSRLIHERFGQILAGQIGSLSLLPYHLALYQSFRKHRTHRWDEALRCAVGALLHKNRSLTGIADDYRAATLANPKNVLGILCGELDMGTYPVALKGVTENLRQSASEIEKLIDGEHVREAAEVAGRAYAKVDQLLPGLFDITQARKITDVLFQVDDVLPEGLSWATVHRFSNGPFGERLEKSRASLEALLEEHQQIVSSFGKTWGATVNPERRANFWIFVISDGERWHSFQIDGDFQLYLESRTNDDSEREQAATIAELIEREFKRLVEMSEKSEA